MRKRSRDETFAPIGPRDYWNPYSLQALRPEKFSSVVNSILRGEQRLLPVARRKSSSSGAVPPLFGDSSSA